MLGSSGMKTMAEPLADVVSEMLPRYARQNSLPAPATASCQLVGRRLFALLETHGWPRPLAPDEIGTPGEMAAGEVAPLVAVLIEGLDEFSTEAWGGALRQLVKACFHPEFRTCRESYREVGADGDCRRQDVERVRTRLSGSHCVDCPYWTDLTPEQHAALLSRHWRDGGTAGFAAHREICLPEDFRRLRRLVRAGSRGIRD